MSVPPTFNGVDGRGAQPGSAAARTSSAPPAIELARRDADFARRELSESLRGMSDSSSRLWRRSRPVLIGAALGLGALAIYALARNARSRRTLRLSLPRPASRGSVLRTLATGLIRRAATRAAARAAVRYLPVLAAKHLPPASDA